MKIIVFSDSHHNTTNMLEVIKLCKSDTSLIVHLGDMVSDFKIIKHYYPDIPSVSVKGNNDVFEVDCEKESVYKFETLNCLFTHGHQYSVKSGLELLYKRAGELSSDLVFFGHTHVPYLKKVNGVLFINPGSINYSPGVGSTFSIVNIKNGKILSSDICVYNSVLNKIDFVRMF